MNLIHLYANECVKRLGVDYEMYHWQLRTHTSITYVEFLDDSDDKYLQFHFETQILGCGLPICQYVVWRDNALEFRNEDRWFVLGDMCFNTFEDAVTYARMR